MTASDPLNPTAAQHTPDKSNQPDLVTGLLRLAKARTRSGTRQLLVAAILGFLTLVTVVVVNGRYFTATAIFEPQPSTAGGLQSIAQEVGVSVNSDQPDASPDFYVQLIATYTILSHVVQSAYPTTHSMSGTPLPVLLKVTEKDSAARVQATIGKLKKIIFVAADRRTGFVRLNVTTHDARLSQAICDSIIARVNDFDEHVRETRGGNERRFLEVRLQSLVAELHQNEDALRDFVARNRAYQDSPTLQLDYTRLQRSVTESETVMEGVRQSYEQARIDEVRDTPVITMVQTPYIPALADARHTLLFGILGAVLGALAFVVYPLGKESVLSVWALLR